jgi:hypothetical protein
VKKENRVEKNDGENIITIASFLESV